MCGNILLYVFSSTIKLRNNGRTVLRLLKKENQSYPISFWLFLNLLIDEFWFFLNIGEVSLEVGLVLKISCLHTSSNNCLMLFPDSLICML